jgi:nucleotide-binding universal stress UspA family protein
MQSPVERIVHPTDFSPASDSAFAHALAIALATRAELTLLNVSATFEKSDALASFPHVRGVLERWKLLTPGSQQRDVLDKLGVQVRKVGVEAGAAVEAIAAYLDDHPADLVVLATEQREGLPRFLRSSVAQRIARAAGARALFVPKEGKGFVALGTGTLSLRRVLVPIANQPSPAAAVAAATRLADAFGDAPVAITLLHIGTQMPLVDVPIDERWTWQRLVRTGDPCEQIVAAARDLDSDLIVMTSDGRDSFLDRFQGSHAEQVVRAAPCPVAAIPVPKPR